mmetsp:Transcript_1749/g.6935  ORF Transcript_1749/g.6935 Transcript_1749/m.6935 type:complete len:209 (-) Transcript_1749:1083-1709(-)
MTSAFMAPALSSSFGARSQLKSQASTNACSCSASTSVATNAPAPPGGTATNMGSATLVRAPPPVPAPVPPCACAAAPPESVTATSPIPATPGERSRSGASGRVGAPRGGCGARKSWYLPRARCSVAAPPVLAPVMASSRATFFASTAAAPVSLYPKVRSIQWCSHADARGLSRAARCRAMKSAGDAAQSGTARLGMLAWTESKTVGSS